MVGKRNGDVVQGTTGSSSSSADRARYVASKLIRLTSKVTFLKVARSKPAMPQVYQPNHSLIYQHPGPLSCHAPSCRHTRVTSSTRSCSKPASHRIFVSAFFQTAA